MEFFLVPLGVIAGYILGSLRVLKVNAVLYFRVADPMLAIIEIQDYRYATGQLAQTTLLSVLGQVELDELLQDRRKVNDLLRQILDERTDFWGIEILAVEIKDVLLPEGMRRAIAKQAEAERERRAKVINAQGGATGLGDSCPGGTHAREPACITAAALPPDGD